MSQTVWKFPVPDPTRMQGDSLTIEVPIDADEWHVGMDPMGNPSVWVVLDPEADKVEHELTVFGTGQEIPYGANYVGTFFQGPFVWHVFDTTGVES